MNPIRNQYHENYEFGLRKGTSFVIFWSVAVFASSQSAPPLIGR